MSEKLVHVAWQHPIVGGGHFTRIRGPYNEEGAKELEAKLDAVNRKHLRVSKIPGIRSLQNASENGVCKTPDGCKVEPDGTCPHGWDSWMKILGGI